MKYEIPVKTAGEFSLPVLGLGTWQMGGQDERDPDNDDERDIAAIRHAIDLGVPLVSLLPRILWLTHRHLLKS